MWATDECKVDIITMSFGYKEVIPKIQDAIAHACSQRVIMLAAAANYGGNHKIAYPANQTESVICIHSTDGNGTPSSFTPPASDSDMNFAVLGEAVQSAWPKALPPIRRIPPLPPYGKTTLRKAGTSFATPIAAGIAATLLHYAKTKFPADPVIAGEEPQRSGSLAKMRAMLGVISVSRGQNYRYLIPCEGFQDNTEQWIYANLLKAWKSKG